MSKKNNFYLDKNREFLYDSEFDNDVHLVFCNLTGITGLSTDLNRIRVDYPEILAEAKAFMLNDETKLYSYDFKMFNGLSVAFIAAQSSMFLGDYSSEKSFKDSLIEDTALSIESFLNELETVGEPVNLVSTTPLSMMGLGHIMESEILKLGKHYPLINWRLLK